MEDNQIINLYFDRSEQAIKETDTKYGGYCYSIAYNILTNQEDAEESVSDTYLSAWNSMPPRRPPALAAFLGKITRNISIDRWRKYRAFKRGEGQIEIALEELSECVSGAESAEETAIRKEILASLGFFELPKIAIGRGVISFALLALLCFLHIKKKFLESLRPGLIRMIFHHSIQFPQKMGAADRMGTAVLPVCTPAVMYGSSPEGRQYASSFHAILATL